MKKLSKILLGASVLAMILAGCANGGLIANDTLDEPEITVAKATENGVVVLKWEAVKDAASYRVYCMTENQEEWEYKTTVWGYSYVDTVDEKDTEYNYKIVALPDSTKTNLLASETEVSVETPEAWSDTLNLTADSIKLSLVPNTVNQYELYFPVNAGYTYAAKYVAATTDASLSAQDLWNQKAAGTWTNFHNSDWSVNISATEYYAELYAAQALVETAFAAVQTMVSEGSETFGDDLSYTEDDTSAVKDKISAMTDEAQAQAQATLDAFTEAYEAYQDACSALAALNEYESYGGTWESEDLVTQCATYSGSSYITELDEDDNEVSPLISGNVILNGDENSFRIVVKATPVNGQVATTKYVLSSQAVTVENYSVDYVPTNASLSTTSSTSTEIKKDLTFYVNKYHNVAATASNYRIYEKLTTSNQTTDGVSLEGSTEFKYLGTASADSSYSTETTSDAKYKYEVSVPADTSTASYYAVFYIAYTNQNGEVQWTTVY